VGEVVKKKSDWAALLLPPALVLPWTVWFYVAGHYRSLLIVAILQCLSGTLLNYLMYQYRDLMYEYRADLRAEMASDRKKRERLYSWEANPAQDASKEPWRES